MNFKKSTWSNWEVMICTTGKLELIVGISSGPRILSLRQIGYENLLYQDTTNFRVGDWHLYGGHRFTVAPETDESYFPDNESCSTDIINSALLIAASKRSSGIQLSLLISQTEDGNGFEMQHILCNKGKKEWVGALWAITCVPRSAQVMAICSASAVNFWPGTDPANWQQINQQMMPKPGTYRGKAGWHQVPVSLTAIQKQGTLTIKNSEVSTPKECVDEGSNLEVFTCRDFIELETLSKQLVIPAGGAGKHVQQWKVFPPSPQ
ncbi:MAG: hypothetical protein ACOH2A_03535 [Sphingobacteriaceae bacterium]